MCMIVYYLHMSFLCKQVVEDLITVGECCTLELTEFEKCVKI